MRKKGIITIWTISLLVVLSYVMTNMDKNQNYVFWINSMEEKELSYHHLITIEQWAEKAIKSKVELPKELVVSKDGLIIKANLEPSDGKININILKGAHENKWKYEKLSAIFARLYPTDSVKILNGALEKVASGDGLGALELLDNPGVFIDRSLVSQSSPEYLKNQYFKEENKVNINVISKALASRLMGVNEEDIQAYIEAHSNKTMDNLSDNPYPQFLQALWKVDSLFYDVKGHIIVNDRRQDFLLHLNKEGKIVKTTKRRTL